MSESHPDTPPVLDILVIDDDSDFLEFVSVLLEDRGHTVRTAGAAPDCITRCEDRLPDVVLLDMHMGHHSGEQVLEQLHERWPKLCVIIVTGYPSMDTMRNTFKRDAFDYLAKPFSVEQLENVLKQAAETFALGLRPQDRLRQQLGQRIRMDRADRKWTLKELSEHSGISVSQLSSIERGTHLPSLDSLLLIAEALNARPSRWLADAGF
ncbi:MAG TPA: response regulator [Phycisphaerales bacterium]|nr:response regulator [Phycisphaerales bacterium]